MATQQLSLPDGTLAYEVAGPTSGRLVVCVHGLGDTRAAYRFLAPALTEAGYRVAVMDVRGYGDSSTDWPEYSTPAIARDIAALVRHLGGGPAVLAGHSFAAGAAAMVSAESPELVDRVIMLGPAVTHHKLNLFLGLVVKLVVSNASLWTMYYKSLYPGPKPPDFAEYLAKLKAGLRRPGRMVPLKRMLASFTPENDADLSRTTVPVLIVMGGKDGDLDDPPAEAERIAAQLAGSAEVRVLPESGHYPHVDDPDTTNSVVVRFLADK